VNLLLDEMFDAEVASALNVLAYRHGCIYSAIRSIAAGAADEQIPTICRDRGIGALVTANVRDFGARLVLYQALLDAGISVVVVRPARLALTPEVQMALLSAHSVRIAKLLSEASGSVLLRLTQGGIVERSLDELRDEIEGRGSHLP
jgi:hypothetical protein